MSIDNPSETFGKKIFFLYPSVIIQNEVIFELIQHEYEAYVIRNLANFPRVLKQFPDSLVYINIDEGLSHQDWDNWIHGILGDPAMGALNITIISADHNEELREKFAADGTSRCTFITLNKTDIHQTIQQIDASLHALNARGRRKYIRAHSVHENMTTINIPYNNTFIVGAIKDISTVGFACTFTEDLELNKNTLHKDLQIRLQSVLLKCEGIVFGSRLEGEKKTYVFLFTQRVDPDIRIKIRTFIQSILQEKINALLQ